ncbi:hypothetical protein [Rhodococcus rhodochrous]|uniref:hypothetical protein n=1 Tax=Rhodococcus rhodochrous TaxID=1829 RepID=UPI0011A6FB9F|nr:hypothetical protein [Rhodococcus rhodochrous]MCD2099158.1 hypothetical protein [Rhodococcus rhodochrous]MCD2120663.1 hypothetical protein [Rhodococcus rhodochrous]MCQ4137932.1 hypothetical protein [Rhodococcus rhodochrous]MDJ0017529.1 hypothetical protein [Rhodococcus rhodochrous]TWH61739.1 hypothetical protein L612_001400001160 [Rhodococcus rhodochrous J38]
MSGGGGSATGPVQDITLGTVSALVAAWWFHYDEWNPVALRALMADDIVFSCASDTGETDYEDFIRVDVRGAANVMAWKDDHRRNSPYPLRHNGTNVFVTGVEDDEVEFSSYIFVTKIVDGRPFNLSSGIVRGSIRATEAGPVFSAVHVVLDTQDSVRYADHFAEVSPRVL